MNEAHFLRKILSVSELTSRIKSMLEDGFSFVWVAGEISNFRMPASGHFYFSLKDEHAQISAVMFRGQNSSLKFAPEDGMQINGLGRISLYEPRGTYQIILEYMEPSGIGALQVAFEQLKSKLTQEGLFDKEHKKPIPFLCNNISLITSQTGAVVHDMLKVLNRRFPNLKVEIIPVTVQGEAAQEDIIQGIALLNRRNTADVAILARGGGSLEDLMPFNSEGVVRAIFDSRIPIIAAIGHETDYTLADFVADLRAPTPSAAAEMVVPVKVELQETCRYLQQKTLSAFSHYMKFLRTRLSESIRLLKDPRKKIQDVRLHLDMLNTRMLHVFMQDIRRRREHMSWRVEKLCFHSPAARLSKANDKLEQLKHNLLTSINIYIKQLRAAWLEKNTKFHALSPEAILARGYSITRTLPDAAIVRRSAVVHSGQALEILLAKGSLHVKVDSCIPEKPKKG